MRPLAARPLALALLVLASCSATTDHTSTSSVVVRCADTRNCTGEIQAALDTDDASDIEVPLHAGSPLQVDPLFIRKGNRTVTFAPGVELLAISMSLAYQRIDASLLSIMNVDNVAVVATGATLRMRKLEYLLRPMNMSFRFLNFPLIMGLFMTGFLAGVGTCLHTIRRVNGGQLS